MPPGRFFRSFDQTRLGHYVCSFFGKTEQKMSFHEWFSTLLRLGLWQNSYVRYSLWLLFQLLSLVSSVTWCHQHLQESSFLISCFFFIITLGSSWSFTYSIWRTHPEMFVIPPKKEVTLFEKLCRIFSPIPVKEKTFFEWFHTEAPAGYQANSTEWILISYFIVSIMVVLVMLVMWLLVIPLLLWFWEKCQRRLLQHSRLLSIVSTGIEIISFLPAAWTLISVVITWSCPFLPKTEPTVLEWVLSFFRIPLKEKCTLSLKCCYARSFLESTSYRIHSTWRFIQVWCLSLLKKVAINIDWKISFHEWFSTLLQLRQNSDVRYSVWLLFQLLSLFTCMRWCGQHREGRSFRTNRIFFFCLWYSWSIINSISRTQPEMFVIPHTKEDTFFEKLSRIFSPIPVKKKTFYERLQTEARADYQANFTKWILINCILVSIMVVWVMIVMVIVVIPLRRWCCERFQRRLPVSQWLMIIKQIKWKTKKEPKEVKSKDGVIRRNLDRISVSAATPLPSNPSMRSQVSLTEKFMQKFTSPSKDG